MAKAKAPKTCKSIVQKGKRKGQVCGKTLYQDTNMCWGHQPKDVKEEKGFGGAQLNSGPKKLANPLEVAREAVRLRAEVLIRPHFKALGFDVEIQQTKEGPQLILSELKDGGAKVYGESKEGQIIPSSIEDLAGQIMAAEKLMDRLFGKPKQTTIMEGGVELKGVDTAPIARPDHAASVATIIANAKANVN